MTTLEIQRNGNFLNFMGKIRELWLPGGHCEVNFIYSARIYPHMTENGGITQYIKTVIFSYQLTGTIDIVYGFFLSINNKITLKY